VKGSALFLGYLISNGWLTHKILFRLINLKCFFPAFPHRIYSEKYIYFVTLVFVLILPVHGVAN